MFGFINCKFESQMLKYNCRKYLLSKLMVSDMDS